MALVLLLWEFFPLAAAGKGEERIPLLRKEELLLPAYAHEAYEFSGLAAWGEDRVLLLPQYKPGLLYAFTKDIMDRKGTIDTLPLHTLPMPDADALRSLIEERKGPGSYEGWEALLVAGNALYLSIETGDDCDEAYLIKGYLTATEARLDLGTLLALPKPRPTRQAANVHNAGFESLALTPDGKLMAIFEYNHLDGEGFAPYLIDTASFALWGRAQGGPLHFRATDAVFTGDTLFVLNFWWRGDHKIYDIPQTLIEWGDTISTSEQDYGRIVYGKYDPVAKKVSAWRPWGRLPYESRANWEGICPMGKGFLLVTDSNLNLKTRLWYVEP